MAPSPARAVRGAGGSPMTEFKLPATLLTGPFLVATLLAGLPGLAIIGLVEAEFLAGTRRLLEVWCGCGAAWQGPARPGVARRGVAGLGAAR